MNLENISITIYGDDNYINEDLNSNDWTLQEDGFAYSNFDNLKNEPQIGDEKPIISTGKYIGGALLDIKLSAKIGDLVHVDAWKSDPKISDGLNEMTVSIWHSERIKSLQKSGNYEGKRNVIKTSIEKRLLSLNTVFLHLDKMYKYKILHVRP